MLSVNRIYVPIIQFAMKKTVYVQQKKGPYAGKYAKFEDDELSSKRNELAAKLIEDGLTFKHAWWSAFKEYPRVYFDQEPESEPELKTDNQL